MEHFPVIFFSDLSFGTQVQKKTLTVLKKEVGLNWAQKKNVYIIIEAKVFSLVNLHHPNVLQDGYSVIHLFSKVLSLWKRRQHQRRKWFITMGILHQHPTSQIQWYPTVLLYKAWKKVKRKVMILLPLIWYNSNIKSSNNKYKISISQISKLRS